MTSLIATRAGRIASAPLHALRLRGGRAEIYAQAGDIDPAFWAETFGDQPQDFAYYQLLERTMASGYLYRYRLLVSPNDVPFALQPLFIVEQDLTISLGQAAAPLFRALRRFFPGLLRSRMLMAGCLVGKGHLGVAKNFERSDAAVALPEALFKYADTEGISFLTIKDFPAAYREELHPLLKAGFARLDGFPPLTMDLDFASFEQYLAERVSRVTRKGLRRKFRHTALAALELTLEVHNDCRRFIDEIYPLYLAVAERSEVSSRSSPAITFSRRA